MCYDKFPVLDGLTRTKHSKKRSLARYKKVRLTKFILQHGLGVAVDEAEDEEERDMRCHGGAGGGARSAERGAGTGRAAAHATMHAFHHCNRIFHINIYYVFHKNIESKGNKTIHYRIMQIHYSISLCLILIIIN